MSQVGCFMCQILHVFGKVEYKVTNTFLAVHKMQKHFFKAALTQLLHNPGTFTAHQHQNEYDI